MAERTVIAESEASTAVDNVHVGYTVYETAYMLGGPRTRYEVVVHNRTYDGIRVESAWDSDPLPLTATDRDAAIEEGCGYALAMMRALREPVALDEEGLA